MTDTRETQETILVVDDDILVRMSISQYLRDCGYKVIEASHADEAMEVLLHKETVVDVVFSDIEMPGAVDGFGLAKWIHEHRPGLDVLLAGTVPRAVESAKDLCEQGPVPKPYDHQIVHNHIRRLLAARKAAR
jgi:DNA-binding NtrC family response regulator